MRIVIACDPDGVTYWAGNGIHRFPLPGIEVFNNYVVLGSSKALVVVNTSGQVIKSTADVKKVGPDTIAALGRYVP